MRHLHVAFVASVVMLGATTVRAEEAEKFGQEILLGTWKPSVVVDKQRLKKAGPVAAAQIKLLTTLPPMEVTYKADGTADVSITVKVGRQQLKQSYQENWKVTAVDEQQRTLVVEGPAPGNFNKGKVESSCFQLLPDGRLEILPPEGTDPKDVLLRMYLIRVKK